MPSLQVATTRKRCLVLRLGRSVLLKRKVMCRLISNAVDAVTEGIYLKMVRISLDFNLPLEIFLEDPEQVDLMKYEQDSHSVLMGVDGCALPLLVESW